MFRVALALVLAASVASASPESAAKAAVKRALDHKTTWKGTDFATAKDAVIADGNGRLSFSLGSTWYGQGFDDGEQSEDDSGDASYVAITITSSLRDLAIHVDADRHVGWFTATLRTTAHSEAKGAVKRPDQRISGIVVDNHGWKIAALFLTQPVTDRSLVAEAAPLGLGPAKGAPRLAGDAAIAKDVAAWFTGGFASHAATGEVAASGSAPDEREVGAKTAELVASWDKLGLGATDMEARTFGGGAIALVLASVRMPLEGKPGKTAPLELAAIVVPDGESWRWVSLQYATPIGLPARIGP
jgi:hypothetical protein